MPTQDIVDEDAIDTEALQAQIDLSMSFAQDLVSSWMAPHKSSTSSRKKNLEQELADYMKRPPRLGVGATPREGGQTSMTRETARLKGKLASKKRSREEEDTLSSLSKANSDDEVESKASTVKKKVRLDPFNVVHGKKKKKDKETKHSIIHPAAAPSVPDDSKGESSDEVLNILNDHVQTVQSPAKPKKRNEEVQSRNPELLAKSRTPEASNPSVSEHKAMNNTFQDSLAKTPSQKKIIPIELLKTPLLNLSGPIHASDAETEDEAAAGTSSTSPKKKRKRRKRKKNIISNESLTAPSVV